MQRNRNLRADLCKKQHLEFIRAEAAIKSILSNPEHAEKLLQAQDAAFLEKLGIGGGGGGIIGTVNQNNLNNNSNTGPGNDQSTNVVTSVSSGNAGSQS